MGQALHSIESEPANTVEINVHNSENLGETRRNDLVHALEKEQSVVSA